MAYMGASENYASLLGVLIRMEFFYWLILQKTGSPTRAKGNYWFPS